MADLSIHVSEGGALRRVRQTRAAIGVREDPAGASAATVVRGALAAGLPSRTGKLRRSVRVVRATHGVYRVVVTDRSARYVLRDTRAHEIVAGALAESAGPTQGHARALHWGTDRFAASVQHPAHRGDRALLARIRTASAPEAIAAAREVMRRA